MTHRSSKMSISAENSKRTSIKLHTFNEKQKQQCPFKSDSNIHIQTTVLSVYDSNQYKSSFYRYTGDVLIAKTT